MAKWPFFLVSRSFEKKNRQFAHTKGSLEPEAIQAFLSWFLASLYLLALTKTNTKHFYKIILKMHGFFRKIIIFRHILNGKKVKKKGFEWSKKFSARFGMKILTTVRWHVSQLFISVFSVKILPEDVSFVPCTYFKCFSTNINTDGTTEKHVTSGVFNLQKFKGIWTFFWKKNINLWLISLNFLGWKNPRKNLKYPFKYQKTNFIRLFLVEKYNYFKKKFLLMLFSVKNFQ